MSDAPRLVYKATNPATIRPIVTANQAARADALATMTAFADLHLPGTEARGFFAFNGAVHLTGFAAPRTYDIPDGLRYDAKKKLLVPALKTPEGKDWATRIQALAFEPAPVPGLSGIITGFIGDSGYFTGATFRIIGDDVYATFTVERLDPRDLSRLDESGHWAPVPLSEFHAALETARHQTEQRAQPATIS